jgi:transcriptional regulator with XRE-family HTH domain
VNNRQAKIKEQVGDRIARIREKRGWSASDLARFMDVTPPAVWNWEKNGIQPRSMTLARLANVLGVTEDYLRNGEAESSVADSESKIEGFSEGVSRARGPKTVSDVIEEAKREIARLAGLPVERVKLSVEFT